MDFPVFLLDRWIEQKHQPGTRIEYDLASSTGPVWTLRDLLALSDTDQISALLDTPISYTSATGTPALRQAIAALEGVDADTVQVVTGASEALFILFFLASEPGANVVLPNPGFPANAALAESLGIAIRYYHVRAENQFRVDCDEIRRLVDRDTRFVLVNSPHNPTGSILTDAEIESLDAFCAERGVTLVSDQVYHPIYHGPAMRSATRLPHATVISDFSKALCLSGLRIGWMIERDAAKRERYLNARNYCSITANVFGERLAVFALQHSARIYASVAEVSRPNLALLDQVFARHADRLRWVRPAGGMTAFPWIEGVADTREFCRGLAQRGVLIAPGDCFGAPRYFRLGFAAAGEKFPSAIERFEEFLDSQEQPVKAAAG
jgi:aspartate/methionine/tyrosine aminotransferase